MSARIRFECFDRHRRLLRRALWRVDARSTLFMVAVQNQLDYEAAGGDAGRLPWGEEVLELMDLPGPPLCPIEVCTSEVRL